MSSWKRSGTVMLHIHSVTDALYALCCWNRYCDISVSVVLLPVAPAIAVMTNFYADLAWCMEWIINRRPWVVYMARRISATYRQWQGVWKRASWSRWKPAVKLLFVCAWCIWLWAFQAEGEAEDRVSQQRRGWQKIVDAAQHEPVSLDIRDNWLYSIAALLSTPHILWFYLIGCSRVCCMQGLLMVKERSCYPLRVFVFWKLVLMCQSQAHAHNHNEGTLSNNTTQVHSGYLGWQQLTSNVDHACQVETTLSGSFKRHSWLVQPSTIPCQPIFIQIATNRCSKKFNALLLCVPSQQQLLLAFAHFGVECAY